VNDVAKLDAGEFRQWLYQHIDAERNAGSTPVVCGDCLACCRASYFIHVAANEKQALASIPKPLLFTAPGMAPGHYLMGYDQQGRCPMLKQQQCTIYSKRPLTCRQYDCRIFTATGINPKEVEKKEIAQQVQRWQFTYADAAAQALHQSVKRAASFLQDHGEQFPKQFMPGNSTQLAALAINVHELFVSESASNQVDSMIQQIIESMQQTSLTKKIKNTEAAGGR